MSERIKMVSYGSNMLKQRLSDRIGHARLITPGFIRGYEFKFHKRSVDGSGKADAYFTGKPDDRIWGVIYELCHEEKVILDGFEGVGQGYESRVVDVVVPGDGLIHCAIYLAQDHYIDSTLKPYDWYKRLVIEGAVQNSLPENYIKFIQSQNSIPDPDSQRMRDNMKLFRRMNG